jgi:hypothetical protein
VSEHQEAVLLYCCMHKPKEGRHDVAGVPSVPGVLQATSVMLSWFGEGI